ncbi:MAG: single-stranded-DNA-specific exonuclease RecJ [SAR324 cluster bacterium]|nr:single-stranded-DNA-specific exonuclease RecJ [SAR324 cluster bacterium]
MSLLDLSWKNQEIEGQQRLILKLSNEFNISKTFASILVSRKLYQLDAVATYLFPSEKDCHHPRKLYQIDLAVNRIYQALQLRQKIAVYGDYDMDGTAATVIMYRYLRKIGGRVSYFIPERLKDGYGMSEATLIMLKSKKVDLIITVDNGSASVKEAHFLRQAGIDLIITDHHQLGTEIPDALAVINPMHPHGTYPFSGLCGAGVAYKLLIALDEKLEKHHYWETSGCIRPNLERDLDLVAIATIADRMPLIDENRFLVRKGLEILNQHPRPGLEALIKACRVHGEITPNAISFKIAPKINAVGRLSDPSVGVKLLLSKSVHEARPFAQILIDLNAERQNIERKILHSAMLSADTQSDKHFIILLDETWHPGLMGNIAAKIASQFHKPTLALTLSQDNFLVGSVRGVGGMDVWTMLERCSGFLEKYGGHEAAAGLSLVTQNLQGFCRKFEDAVELALNQPLRSANELMIDTWIEGDQINQQFIEELTKMSPFGSNNPEPVLGISGALVKKLSLFGKNHLKFMIETCAKEFEIVAWEHSDWYLKLGKTMDLAVTPQGWDHDNHENKPFQFKAIDVKSA